MSRLKSRLITFLSCTIIAVVHCQSNGAGIGSIQTQVPWRAGHASVYEHPYMIVYGGSEDISSSASATNSIGSTGLWAWDSRNGSWYQPTVQVQGGAAMLPQIYFQASNLPSQGQIVALVGNTTGGLATGVLQKLDTNSWSWSFPTSNFQASAKAVGYTMTLINNTVYTYGGLTVNANGFPNQNAVQNTLSLIDTNSFQVSSGANGLGLSYHTTCYLKKCNCLVTFGGTTTGNPTEVTDAVNIYDLNSKVWNVQGIVNAGTEKPGARRLHTANCLDDIMVVYGGGTSQPTDTDVWVLNATSYPQLSWKRMNVQNGTQGPNLRMGHSSVYDDVNKKIYIFGGWGVSATNDSNMYVLDVVNWSWTRVPTTGYPPNAMPNTNTTNPDNKDPSHFNNSSLGAGAIAGIAVGSILGLIALAIILFFLIRKKRRDRNKNFVGEEFSENIQHDELKLPPPPPSPPQQQQQGNENPYIYSPGGFYSMNDNEEHEHDPGYYTTSTHYNNATSNNNNKRTSRAWNGTLNSNHSFLTARRSEIGDSDRVVTGILEEVDDGTVAATRGSRSPRESFRNSKVLLVSPTEYIGQGQVPNEIISQKPNEFSIPAARFAQQQQQQQVPIDHHHAASVALSDSGEGAPLSSSMEVLRSIKTTGSSMMNNPGSHLSNNKKAGVPVTHATIEDDEWNSALVGDNTSLSVRNGPIQYILPNSHQLSTATSTQTWDTKQLVNHHYPSSTLNLPMAETVTPPTTTNNSNHSLSEPSNVSPVNIYNTMSPLDALANLGQQQQQQQTTPGSSQHGSSTILKNMHQDNHTTTTSNSSTTANNSSSIAVPDEQQFLQLAPLISALPRRYQLDKSKSPITGPTNNILFATHNDKHVAIKAFGRREAWERECKTLIKLKSSSVVEILEVLTIQGDQQPLTRSNNEEEQEGEIKYVTVMERLDETLSSYIRNSKRSNYPNAGNGTIARDILKCLSWCHDNGIAFCDLKPSNIMHDNGKPWKLIDFEGSRTIDEECVGVITPRYCPPEVARATTYGLEGANGVVATASVDLWSFGCVLYELETKKALFASNIKDQTILHFVSHPSPSTPILNNGLRWNDQKELEIPHLERLIPNAHTRQLIKTLLSREPSKRGSASQLLENPYFN